MPGDVGGRHVESLLREYGELSRVQAEQAVEIRHASEDRDDIRDEMEKMEKRLLKAMADSEKRMVKTITEVDVGCKAFRAEYRADRKEALERSDRARASSRTIVVAVIAGSCTVLAAIVAAAATILTGG